MNRRQRIFIVEGPDRCGKTHIAHALSECLNIPYFKNTFERSKFNDVRTDYFSCASKYIDTYMPKFLEQTGHSVIFDRNYPSEFVYPRVFDRMQDIDTLRRIDDAHARLGTYIIMPFRTSYDGITDEHHAQITPERLRELDDAYVEFHRWTSCNTFRLNVDDEDIHRELTDILMFLMKSE